MSSMKITSGAALLLILLTLPADASEPSLATLSWLSGCWASVDGEQGSGEHWTNPAGESMLGVSRTVRDGKTVAFEFMRIAKDGNRILFVASPSGQQTATFVLSSQSSEAVVFTNPKHDFPQKVMYRKKSPDMLIGRIEGTVNGEKRSVEFPMIRARCNGELE